MALGRVRQQRTFRALRRDGVRGRSGPVTVTVLVEADLREPRAAFAVGRRVGPAVVRNKVRRRLRAIAHELGLPPATYLFTATPAAAALPYDELRRHVTGAVAAATGGPRT